MSRKRLRSLRPIDRRRFVEVCASSLVLAAAGCRRAGDPAYSRGNTLVMAIRDVSAFMPGADGLDYLYCPRLAALDENGELQPHLAQSWEHSRDYLEWTYHLRTDALWSDGVPVTAHDVKFTLDLLQHPDVSEGAFESVSVLDDFTVKIRGGVGYQTYITCFPKHVLEHLDPKKFKGWDFWLHPTVSAGPYRFVRYLPETMMEFEANPHYFRGKPKIERLVYKFVGQAGLTELLSGNADVVLFADPAQIPRVTQDPRFRVYHKVGHYASAIFWKCDHPLFRDARVRRALTLAIDRRELLEVINLPRDLPITDGVFTQRQFQRRQFSEPLPYDPVQSRALLEAAGWQDHGDGVREREGRPFRFAATVRSDQGYDRLAVYVQAQLRQVGVQMEIQLLDTSLVWDRLRAGNFEALFQIHQPGLGAQRRDFGRNNRIGYQNPEVVRLTDQDTADPDELDRIYRALTEILRAELPVTHLVPQTTTAFAHRRVRGIAPYMVTILAEDLGLENER